MKQSVSIIFLLCSMLLAMPGQFMAQHYQKNWEKWQQGQWHPTQAKAFFAQVSPADPAYPHARLVYGDLLAQEAKEAAQPENYTQAIALVDSAIHAYTRALQSNDQGLFKKNNSYFLVDFEKHVQKLPLKSQWSLVQEAIDRKVHQMERWQNALREAKEHHQLFRHHHLLAELSYQELLEASTASGNKKSFQEALQALADSINRHQNLCLRHATHVETALKKIHGPGYAISIQTTAIGSQPAERAIATHFWVIDYTEWLQELKQQQQAQTLEVLSVALSYWDSLSQVKTQLEQGHQHTGLASYQVPAEVLAFLVETEQEPLQITLFFQYLASWIRVQAQFQQEAQFLRYTSQHEATIRYYFQLMELAQRTKNLMDMLKEAEKNPSGHFKQFASQVFGSMETFRSQRMEEEMDLAQKERYCQIRIKDQLVLAHLENKFIPKYAWYNNKAVPLFEQPLDMAVEPNHYVTTEVVKLPEGGMVVTGFQRNKRKEAFIAKISHKEVVWLKNIHTDNGNAAGEAESIGMTLIAQKGTYTVVVKYLCPGGEVWNQLKEYRENGQLEHTCKLANNQPTETLLKHGEGYLVVFHQERGAQTPKAKWLELVGKQGQSIWKHALPANGVLTALIALEGKIYVTTNLVAPRDSNGMPLKNTVEKSNPYLAIFNQQGELIFQHQFLTKASYFITQVVVQEDGDLLLLGFLGNFNLNEIQEMPIAHIVYQPSLHKVHSDIAGVQKDWENTYPYHQGSAP